MSLLLNNATGIDWEFYRRIGHDFRPDILQKLVDQGYLNLEPVGYVIVTNLGGTILNPELNGQIVYFVYAKDATNFAIMFLANTKYDWFIQEVNGQIVTTKEQLIIKKPGQD